MQHDILLPLGMSFLVMLWDEGYKLFLENSSTKNIIIIILKYRLSTVGLMGYDPVEGILFSFYFIQIYSLSNIKGNFRLHIIEKAAHCFCTNLACLYIPSRHLLLC